MPCDFADIDSGPSRSPKPWHGVERRPPHGTFAEQRSLARQPVVLANTRPLLHAPSSRPEGSRPECASGLQSVVDLVDDIGTFIFGVAINRLRIHDNVVGPKIIGQGTEVAKHDPTHPARLLLVEPGPRLGYCRRRAVDGVEVNV